MLTMGNNYGNQILTYFIQAYPSGLIKIGITTNIDQRFSGLTSGCSEKLQILGLFSGDREREFHKKFAAHHAHHEWFFPGEPILSFIRFSAKYPVDKHHGEAEPHHHDRRLRRGWVSPLFRTKDLIL